MSWARALSWSRTLLRWAAWGVFWFAMYIVCIVATMALMWLDTRWP